MIERAVHDLLLAVGFRQALAPFSARWVVVGRAGRPVRITCMSGARGGYVLLVASERERREVAALLERLGAGTVDVRAEEMTRARGKAEGVRRRPSRLVA